MCYSPIIKHISKKSCEVVKELPHNSILIRSRNETLVKCLKDFTGQANYYLHTAKNIYVDDLSKPNDYFIELPCGKCADCLNRIVNKWSFRLAKELEFEQVQAFFVTLTYDPTKRCKDIFIVDKRTGEIKRKKNAYEDLFGDPIKCSYIDLRETDPLADNEIYYDDVYNNINIPKDKAYFRHYLKVPKLSPVDVENYDYVEEDGKFLLYYGENVRYKYDVEKIYSDELAEFHCDNGFLNYDDVQKFFKRVRQQLKYYYGIDYVRYFCCGEYSPAPHYTPDGRLTEGFLPHYHLLIWFKHSLKSQYGWIKPVPKRNKNKESDYLPLVKLLPDGRAHVPPLTVAVFQDFLFRAWNLSDRKAFVCSPVRSIVGCTRYISKYILKAVNAAHYKDDVQSLRPFKRWMSQGIAKGYAEYIAPQICTNFSFGFKDGKYFRFYPSIFLKWSYSHDIEIQKNDFLKWYDNDKYFIMLRNREKYISEMDEPTLRNVEDKRVKVRNMLETLSADSF